MNIFILHPGKANYPEVQAYKNYFGNEYNIKDGTLKNYKNTPNKENTILWCIMGFYPKKLKAKFVIHDYRSLSVGKYAKIKDALKKKLNNKPNLRIFQNEDIKNAMGFIDEVDSILLPMGVPSWIFTLKPNNTLPSGTYCYIGEISSERNMDNVINAFTRTRPNNESLILVGKPEKKIYDQYCRISNVIFTGKIAQEEALTIVLNSEFALCPFPSHYPHCLQAPTKFLEYAALGKKIICNKSPSNYKAASEIQSFSCFVEDDIFSKDLKEKLSNIQISLAADPTSISWENLIYHSGLPEILKNLKTSNCCVQDTSIKQ